MREHLLNKAPLHMANMAGTQWRGQMAKGGGPLPARLPGDVFHFDHRGQFDCHEPNGQPCDPGEDMEGHDIISAVQHVHEETVALWLAVSWRCNLGCDGRNAPRPGGNDGFNRRRHS